MNKETLTKALMEQGFCEGFLLLSRNVYLRTVPDTTKRHFTAFVHLRCLAHLLQSFYLHSPYRQGAFACVEVGDVYFVIFLKIDAHRAIF